MARRPRDTVAQANAEARAALAAAGSSGTLLGALAWWDSVEGWKKPAAEVTAAVNASGLDASAILPAAPDWIVAFGRAVQAVKASIHARNFTLIDAAEGPNKERRVAVVRIARNGRVQTTDEGTITCPRDGSSAFIERADADGIAQAVLDKARTLVDIYTSDDVRAGAVTLFERWAVKPCRVRAPHVVYWAPPPALDVIRQFRSAVESVGWGQIELFVGHSTEPENVRAITNTVNKGLEESISEFTAAAAAYASATSKTRPATIEGQIEQARQLREQADLYRAILGSAVISIDERMTEIENALRATLGLVEARAS